MPIDIFDILGMLLWILGLTSITAGFAGLLIYVPELIKLLWQRRGGFHRQ